MNCFLRLAQKEGQLTALKTELTHKEAELTQLNAQVDALRRDVNHQYNLAARLNDDLETQRSKNNVSYDVHSVQKYCSLLRVHHQSKQFFIIANC